MGCDESAIVSDGDGIVVVLDDGTGARGGRGGSGACDDCFGDDDAWGGSGALDCMDGMVCVVDWGGDHGGGSVVARKKWTSEVALEACEVRRACPVNMVMANEI